MLSAVKRYKSLLSGALARYFPRTTAYLREEREAAQAMAAQAQKKPRGRGRKGATSTPKGRSSGKKSAPKEPGGVAAPAAEVQDDGIYGGPLRQSAGAAEAMREKVAAAVAAGVVAAPSDEQWAMILGRAPVTRIFAGAGSGKSTTLVLRVVFMLCHLGIEPGKLTVISFTNASCAQLRDQLQRVLGFWEFTFDAAQARQCVRTFHSAMGVLAKAALGNPAWFEQLDDRDPSAEPDNPLAAGRLRPAQQRLLEEAYQACYAADAGFRQRVHRLLGLSEPVEEEGATIGQAPRDALRLAGELTALPLPEAFHAQAGFIESIGLRIDQLQPAKLTCPPQERLFIEALQPFWARFQALLRERGAMTFNDAFAELTQRLPAGSLDAALLEPLTHLLIDEFQDISPQIVQWLQAVHRQLARSRRAPSLMAIGDDWQSIYGWRGSSPELFMDFDRHFPGKGKAKKSKVLLLETNYRSIETVVRDGEAVLGGVAFKQEKSSRAVKLAQPEDGVRLVQGFDLAAGLPNLVADIQAQCRHVEERGSGERTAVLLLGRRNEALRSIQAQLDPALPVKAYSIHRAKGLQAEVAVIVDDCLPTEAHPLRNTLYARCGFFRNSYDQAMRDESLRLAYVAITRGVSRVVWYCRKAQGATAVLAGRGR
ncbi:DEAD/DEAH box helicase [Pseudomonas sp. PDM13]|uniref:DEAD/DEAH box helicase n=1 Tax=Pseudomonas sp. PDM13 TaxID=2769255 RepID=UPI0021DF49DF|nr:DEAD/DEAH box helicase [Pseudomonas sp. PDM13]MCU9951100.1 DEAD/DEAH box helicase [Pseudomonas sp. PDM13]